MSLRLMVFADLHYGGVFKEGDRCIEELTDVMEREKPDACIYLGDLCDPIPKHKHVREKLESPGFSIYYIIGNHETDAHELDEIKEFLSLKDSYYSVDMKGYRFIFLNTCYCRKAGATYPFFENNYKDNTEFPILPDEELEWLKKELATDKKVLVFSHHSLINEFARRGLVNREQIRKLLEDSNTILCMNGHDHGSAYEVINGIPYFTVNSTSYVWLGSLMNSTPEKAEKYAHMRGILTYEHALYVMVEIDENEIRIKGVEGKYKDVTPEEIGLDSYRWNGVSVRPRTESCTIPLRRSIAE